MRVTGGIYSGRQVKCPKGVIRPSMDRMRESVFSILGNMEGLSFLDMFSGSGVIGIEAASRGAEPVVLVEKDFIKKNVIKENISFVESDIQCAPDGSFDLVFLDPPFPRHKKKELIEKIGATSLVKEGGLLMIHYPSEDNLDQEKFEAFELIDERKYGRSIVLFYKKKASAEENQEAAVR